ncbi:MAG: hypothetical protein WCI51_06565 [Lentisphaerota bacterium]
MKKSIRTVILVIGIFLMISSASATTISWCEKGNCENRITVQNVKVYNSNGNLVYDGNGDAYNVSLSGYDYQDIKIVFEYNGNRYTRTMNARKGTTWVSVL